MMMMMMVMVMNCFCGMVDQQKEFSLISSRDHCQGSSPSQISDTPPAGFEPAQNLSSGLVEWSCAIVITTTPRCIKGRRESRQAAEPNQYFWHSIDVLKAKWCQFHEIDSNEDNDDEELEEIDMFLENDVTKYTAKANVDYFFNCDSLHPRLNSHYEAWS